MISAELRELIENCAERKSAHLIDLVIRGSNHKSVVEVFVDAEQGVTTAICSEISREITGALESSPLLKNDYVLTVSSPGVERSLKFPWQYAKHVGRSLCITMDSETGVKELTGKCVSMNEQGVTLEIPRLKQSILIRFNSIREAKVTVPW